MSKRPSLLYRVSRRFFRISFRVAFRFEAHGIDHVPKTGGCMLVANHASNLDPPLSGIGLERDVHFMAKAELFRVPPLGWWIQGVNGHPFNRDQVDRATMGHLVELMRGGEALVVYPEGTRSEDGRIHEFNPLVARMALQAGVPCVPTYLDGSFRALPRGSWLPRPFKVRVFYGEPVMLEPAPPGVPKKEHYRLCAHQLQERVEALAGAAIAHDRKLAGPLLGNTG